MLDNPDGVLNSSLLTEGVTLQLDTKLGDGTYMVPVAIEEVDLVQPERKNPTRQLTLSARDRMAWLTDRSQSQDAQQFDNTIIGYDNFADIAGQQNTGLAHMATVAGSFKTESNTLISQTAWRESISFSTFKSNIEDGVVSTIFSIPKANSHGNVDGSSGQTPSSSNAPTYAGVIWRAVDKDNFWYCRWNYWTSTMEIGYRLSGTDNAWATATLSSMTNWNSRMASEASVGVRVEFKGARVAVYMMDAPSSPEWHLAQVTVNKGALDNTSVPLKKGYVGVIGCGFSDAGTGIEEYGSSQLLSVLT